jgi:hypothetical protein
MKTITIITHYFGPLPAWYRLFLRTCEWNASIRWIVVTDQYLPWNLAANITVVRTTLDALAKLAAEQTGFSFHPSSGYRVGDWRPAFGDIFAAHLIGADFWGHCDPDVFFGNVRKFITEEMLNQNTIISSDRRQLCGAFTLYRNDARTNGLYRRHESVQSILNEIYAPGFDEAGMDGLLRRVGHPALRLLLCSCSERFDSVTCSKEGVFPRGGEEVLGHHFRRVKAGLALQCRDDVKSWTLEGSGIWETGSCV